MPYHICSGCAASAISTLCSCAPSRTWRDAANWRIQRTTELDGWNGWNHLRQVLVVEQTTRDRHGEEETELRYFVSNATTGMLPPRQLLMLVRQHWGIENDCNWTFDMQFGEDDGAWCTVNKAMVVLGVLRMVASDAAARPGACYLTAFDLKHRP